MDSWNAPSTSKMNLSFNSNPNPNNSCNNPQELRPIEEIPHPYQEIFAEYPGFNAIQSKILDDILYTDTSLVVSAPTGSGKTTIFELAIVRLLLACEKNKNINKSFKIVYVSPMKALCEERLVDWHRKFAKFGLNCILVTGDSEITTFEQLLTHNLIITTPEKWDSLTRRWKDNRKLVQSIKLFMIDEVHLLNEEQRGSTLEMIVCRMKTIEESTRTSLQDQKIRFVAVSATLANIEDIAEWIGKFSQVKHFKFSNNFRPVKLNKIVIGYPHNVQSTHFKFDFFLNFKLQVLIMKYSNNKPTLIFATTRKMVELTAKHLLQNLTLKITPEQKTELASISSKIIGDENVRSAISHGIGYHHAGLLSQNRKIIENAFREGKLPILVTTSTLSVGINLPAHLVIVKSTKFYSNGKYQDYSETMVMQMIGRAGRPQFDTSATALILTSLKDKEKFERMVGGSQVIESNLHRHLVEHLNAEVVLRTITDLDVAMQWISTTFLYVRAKKNPRYYGIPSSSVQQIDEKLLEMCQIDVNKLVTAGMMTIDADAVLQPTPEGVLMAKYYLTFETMKLFTQMSGREILQQMLAVISKCAEFSHTFLRVNDKKCLNLLNKCRDKETIRFPLNGRISSLDMKINCVIQAVLGCLDICDHSIYSETFMIMRNGERIAKCLIEYLETKSDCFKALLNTIILAKCLHAKLWENSPYVSKQLTGIGPVLSNHFVNAGKTTFQAISDCDPREIEMIINKKPPTGDNILDQIRFLPKYSLCLELNGIFLRVRVNLENYLDLQGEMSGNPNALMHLLIGDSENKVYFYAKYSHSFMVENPQIEESLEVKNIERLESVEAHFISEDFVGIDCKAVFELNAGKKSKEPEKQKPAIEKKPTNPKKKKNDVNYRQNFMEMYLKIKEKRVGKNTKTDKNKSKNIKIHSNVVIPPNKPPEFSEIIESEQEMKKTVDSSSSIEEKAANNNESSKYDEDYEDFWNSDIETSVSQAPQLEKPEIQASFTYEPPVEEKPNKFNKFKFTPKKLTHSATIQVPQAKYRMGENLLAEVKKNVFTPKKQSQPVLLPLKEITESLKPKRNVQKISWRSPVIANSPAVKFSPVFAKNPLLNETKLQKNQSFEIRNATESPARSITQSQLFFPLSDKDCSNISYEEELNSIESQITELSDYGSRQFFEQVGLEKHYRSAVNKRNFNETSQQSSPYTPLVHFSQRKKFKYSELSNLNMQEPLVSVARRQQQSQPIETQFLRPQTPSSSIFPPRVINKERVMLQTPFSAGKPSETPSSSGYSSLYSKEPSFRRGEVVNSSSYREFNASRRQSPANQLAAPDSYSNRASESSFSGFYRNYNREENISCNNSPEGGFASLSQINEEQLTSASDFSQNFRKIPLRGNEEFNSSESLSPICGSQSVVDTGYEYSGSTIAHEVEEDPFDLNYAPQRQTSQIDYRRRDREIFDEEYRTSARGRYSYFSQPLQENEYARFYREEQSLPRFHVSRNYNPELELRPRSSSYVMDKFLHDIGQNNAKYFR